MTRPDLVRAFIRSWETRDVEAILAAMTEDAVYHNIGLPEAVGHGAIRAFIGPFLAGSRSVDWTVSHIAETSDGAVLTERIDRFVLADRTLTIPVMGVFEFRGELICAWRDYFDVPAFQAQMA